jgi:DNA-binding transcriptional LysR family regulator
MIKLRDLDYLIASAAAGNFTRAANSLGISTSTISRHVGRLEDELGLALFERGHRGIRLTAGGKAVLKHARRAVAELEAVRFAGRQNGIGAAGEVRLGVRMPPIGEAMLTVLSAWREKSANVLLTISEMHERDLAIALDERRLDVALAPSHMLSTRMARLVTYRERLFAALPAGHALARHEKGVTWAELSGETILVQGWDESQAEREFLVPLLGSEVCIRSNAASRQAILALVAGGFGISIGTESEAAARFPGVIFRPVDEKDAVLQLDLAWLPETEEPAVGRFVAFIRDKVRSRGLV